MTAAKVKPVVEEFVDPSLSNFPREDALLKAVEYVMSETFTRLVCLGFSVFSHGLANFAEAAKPSGNKAILDRANSFRSYVFNGDAESTDGR